MSTAGRTECFYNLSMDVRLHLMEQEHRHTLEWIYRLHFGWITLPIASLGLFLTSFFIFAVYKAIVARRVSRKCYILLLNRAFGDFTACITALLIVGYVLLFDDVKRDVVSLMDCFFSGSFWSAMISYVTLSVLKLFAVAYPFHYRKWVTMKRCIKLCVLSWVVFMFIVGFMLSITAVVKIPFLQKLSDCRAETCLRTMYRVRNFFTIIVYCFTLAVFVATVILVRRAQRFVNSFKRREQEEKGKRKGRTRFPLKKLALNVATFATLHFPYMFWCIWLLTRFDPCYFQRNFNDMMMWLSFVRLTLLIRIIIDPILAFITDFQIRRILLSAVGLHRKVTWSSSRGFRNKSATVSDSNNSSEDAVRTVSRTRESTVKTIA